MALPAGFVDELEEALGTGYVITDPEKLATYDCDGLTGWRAQPACVVLPGSAGDVQSVLRLCARDGIPFVARGAGTGLSGGALPVADGQNLTYALYELFSDPGVMRDMARAAAGAVEGLGGALGRTVQAIEPFIAQMKLEEY